MKFRSPMTAAAVVFTLLVGVRPTFAADPLTDFLDHVFGASQTQRWTTMIRFKDRNLKRRQANLHEGDRVGWRTTHTGFDRNYLYLASNTGSVWRASWYGGGEKLNAHTSDGERFRPMGLTAAHRTLPMGTRLQVCYRGCAVVRVNDRGPALSTGRSLDLARGAASQIGMIGSGVANVRVAILH